MIPESKRPGSKGPLLGIALLLLAVGGWFAWKFLFVTDHLARAKAALEAQKYIQAEKELKLAVEQSPDSAEAHLLLARVSRQLMNLVEAEKHLSWYGAHGNRDDHDYRLERYFLRAHQGELQKIEPTLRTYIKQKENRQHQLLAYEALVRAQMERGFWQRARDTIREWQKIQPESIQALACLSEIFTYLNAPDQGAVTAEKVLKIDPDRSQCRLMLAEFYQQDNKQEKAIPHYLYMLEREPNREALIWGLTDCYLDTNQLDKAEEMAKRHLQLNPQSVNAIVNLGELELKKGNPEQAEQHFLEVMKREPMVYEARAGMIKVATRLGRLAEAEKLSKDFKGFQQDLEQLDRLRDVALRQSPRNPSIRFQIAEIFFRWGDVKKAQEWAESAHQLSRQHKKTNLLLAKIYEQQGDKETAAEHLRLAGVAPSNP